MAGRYGAPIVGLNLVKHFERTRRETILLDAFEQSVGHLNASLPDKHKIHLLSWDFSKATKLMKGDPGAVLQSLLFLCEWAFQQFGMFDTAAGTAASDFAATAKAPTATSDGSAHNDASACQNDEEHRYRVVRCDFYCIFRRDLIVFAIC